MSKCACGDPDCKIEFCEAIFGPFKCSLEKDHGGHEHVSINSENYATASWPKEIKQPV